MTAREGREEGHPDPDQGRLDNGLRAPTYVPLTDVDPAVGQHLLTALGRARIAAYLGPTAAADEQRRLFVASEERGDARTIVASAVRALGASGVEAALVDDSGSGPDGRRPDVLDGQDTDALFHALVADWHVDTHNAIRDAERELSREDAEWRARLSQPPVQDPVWLDEDHYVPPPPPPLPRLSGPTVLAVCVIVVSILMLGMGTQLGFSTEFTMVLGVGGLLLAAGILLSRLRDHDRDEDDDGAAI